MTALTALSKSNYARNRDAMQSGDVLAWSRNGFFSRIVRLWTGQTYSHVGVVWVVGGRVLILEAKDGVGVVAVPMSARLAHECYWIPTTADWGPRAEREALDQLGKGYSFWNDFLVGLGLKISTQSGRWQCAQYVMAVLAKAGVPLNCAPTPGALVDALLHRS